MSRSVNEVMLVGNVGKDPEVQQTKTGTMVAKFSLATTSKYKDNERTEWHRLVTFGKLAEIVEKYVKKGDRLYIRGALEYSTSEYEGTTRYWTDIVVRDLVMLGGNSGGGAKAAEPALSAPDDDLPF